MSMTPHYSRTDCYKAEMYRQPHACRSLALNNVIMTYNAADVSVISHAGISDETAGGVGNLSEILSAGPSFH